MVKEAACDVLVIGSGAGGLAAAITARHHGLDVVVVEKAERFGGTTARSGGVLWIPCNPLSQAASVSDTLDAARAYLRHECGPTYDAAKVDAYLASGPEMVDFFTRHTQVRFTSVGTFPDYHPDAPGAVAGGRSIQAKAYLRGEYGPALKRHPLLRKLARPLPGATFLGLNVARDELTHFYSALRSGRSLAYVMGTLLRHFADLLIHRCSLRAVNGNALAARLGASASDLGIPIRLSTPALELLIEDGRVVGALVEQDGKPVPLRARRAVILASGGFPHDVVRRATLYPHRPGEEGHFSVAPEGNVGDGARLAESAGGRVAADWPSAAAWTPVSTWRDSAGARRVFPHFIDRGKPGIIAVGPDGRRFVNESGPYPDIGLTMAHRGAEGGASHGWLIADHRAFRRYGLGIVRPAPIPFGVHLRSGYLIREKTPAALAGRLGMEPARLSATLAAFNDDARSGIDREFGKGGNIYNRYQGDPAHRPNPCLAPLETAPFYAVKIVPGDIGTFAGIMTDAQARALDAEGKPIPGLYAVGNDQASVFGGSYPGGGATLGPAMTFGFIAGRHIAGTANREDENGL